MLKEEELEELEKALRAASPAPWRVPESPTPHKGEIRVEENSEQGIETVAILYCGAYTGHGLANAAAIAALRNLAPALIEEIRASRAWRKEAERLLREARGHIEGTLWDRNPHDRPGGLLERMDAFLVEGTK